MKKYCIAGFIPNICCVKDPPHLLQAQKWPVLTIETIADKYGCQYSYNIEKTPDMPSYNGEFGFQSINVDLYRLLSPGYHLIHSINSTPARASILGDFGFQTTAPECRPEIVSIDAKGVKTKIGQVNEGSDVYCTPLEGHISYSGDWSLIPDTETGSVYIHLPEIQDCRYILQHASITFLRPKTDPEAFTIKNCPLDSPLWSAFANSAMAPRSIAYIRGFIDTMKDVRKAIDAACTSINKHISQGATGSRHEFSCGFRTLV